MRRCVSVLIAGMTYFLALGFSAAWADEPTAEELAKLPPYERLLAGEDAKRAADTSAAIGAAEEVDDYEKAIGLAKELLELRTAKQGQDHWEAVDAEWRVEMLETVATLAAADRQACRDGARTNREGQSLHARGKYAEAQPLFEKTLDIRRKFLGEEHPDTATSYQNLAANLNAQAKFAEAQPLFHRALEIGRKSLGEEHPNTATRYDSLAVNLHAQAQYAEAEPLMQKALEIRRKALGDYHAGTATSYDNLAANLMAQGKYAEAEVLNHKSLEIWRKTLGEDHADTAVSYNNLAAYLSFQGKYAEAQPLYERALDILRKIVGEEHPNTAGSYHNLAANLNAQAKYSEAETFYRKSLEIARNGLGEQHPNTAISYNNLALNLKAQGKYLEAQPLLEIALDIRRRILGDEHPDIAISQDSLAANLNAQAKYAEGEPFYQRALEIRQKSLGDEHPSTAMSYYSLAANLNSQAKYAEAQPLFHRALEIRRKTLGDEHPDTAASGNDLAMNQYVQGQRAEAEWHLELAGSAHDLVRVIRAGGLDRSLGRAPNPRLLHCVIQLSRDPEAACWTAELTFARGLLDQQSNESTALLTDDERAEQVRWRAEVAALQPQILALVTKASRNDEEQAHLDALLQQRRGVSEQLTTLVARLSEREVADPEAIRAALPDDGALLFWIDVTDHSGGIQEYWACLVRRTGEPRWQRLPGTGADGAWTKADTELPQQFRSALADGAPAAEVNALAKALRAQRLSPLDELLRHVKRLYVIGTDAMAGVPVETLARDHIVSYVPSGTYLARLNDRPLLASSGCLALGDPVFDRPGEGQTPSAQESPASDELPPGGLLILQVAPGGGAAAARLQAGDVLVRYGDVELTKVEELTAAIQAQANAKEIGIVVWREGAGDLIERAVPPGKLGVALHKAPAREAIADRRQSDALLLALRGGSWQELPGTRVEVARIARHFDGEEEATVWLDSAANEESLDRLRRDGGLAKYRYLHFATHGEANIERAFDSALILAQDSLPELPLPRAGEPFLNGQLAASEVLQFWKLDAELVTLSACETAVGRGGGGDGMLGIAQAFLTAGSRSVCLSLWKVDDTATALLMDRFYQNLLGQREGLAGPMPKSEALSEAKRWLRDLTADEALRLAAAATGGVVRGDRGKGETLELALPKAAPNEPAESVEPAEPSASTDGPPKPFAHPKYWSAFILIGDPN